MPETVRVVSDREDLVLQEGEAYSILPRPEARATAVERVPAAPPRIAIRYQGFTDASGRREYALDAQRGDERRRYTVWIEEAAFAARRALRQDGPDICYQKLLRELAASPLDGVDSFGVTDGELAAYTESHTRQPRRGFSPSSPTRPNTPPAAAGGDAS